VDPAAEPHSFDAAAFAYATHLEHIKRASKHTLTNYARDIGQLRAFLVDKKHPAIKDLRKLDVIALRGFLAERHRADATTSVLRKLSAIRGFLKHAKKEKRITSSPAELLDSPKRPKSLPKTVSVDEAFALCDAPIANGDERHPARDRAIVELLYGAGLRVSELCGLDIADIDLKGRWLRVLGKGNKERMVPFHDACAAALEAWLKARPGAGDDAVFLGARGAL
jgi:integrase/recombinase XerC